jgi:hypothetical protein
MNKLYKYFMIISLFILSIEYRNIFSMEQECHDEAREQAPPPPEYFSTRRGAFSMDSGGMAERVRLARYSCNKKLHQTNFYLWEIFDPKNRDWLFVRECFDDLKRVNVISSEDIGEFLCFVRCWQDRIDGLLSKIRVAEHGSPLCERALEPKSVGSYIAVLEMYDRASAALNMTFIPDKTIITIRVRIREIVERISLCSEQRVQLLYLRELMTLANRDPNELAGILSDMQQAGEIDEGQYAIVLSLITS